MDITDLHERLTRLAEHTAPPAVDAATLTRGLLTRHRAQRRQRLGIGAVVVAVVAVVMVVPTVLTGARNSGMDSGRVPTVDVVNGPIRGSLANDTTFIDGVRQLPWAEAAAPGTSSGGESMPSVPNPPVDTRRVVFVGAVAGTRIALVVGENTTVPKAPHDAPSRQSDLSALSHLAAAWFTGPADASAAEMSLVSPPHGIDTSQPLAYVDAATGGMVVVSLPGDGIELSLRPEVAADGTIHRSWQSLDAPDGSAVSDLSAERGGLLTAVRYRVLRGGSVVLTTAAEIGGNSAPPSPVLVRLRPGPTDSAADQFAAIGVGHALGQLGLTADKVIATVLWTGNVPGPAGNTATAWLVSIALPSGAIYLTSPWAINLDGGAGGSLCGSGVLAAGPPIDQRTTALRCDITDGTSDSKLTSSLVVVAPPAAVRARALDLEGNPLGEYTLSNGVAVVPFPRGTVTVQTLASDGTSLATATPLSQANLGD